LAATIARYGYDGSSVERIVKRAGVSRRTFYEQFADREQAYLEAYDEAAGCLLERLRAAWEEPGGGAGQLRQCLRSMLETVAAEPRLARTFMIDVLAVGPPALERRERHMRSFAALLERGARAHDGSPAPPLAADGLAAAIYEAVLTRVSRGQTEELPGLLEDLHSFCLMIFHYSAVAEPS
jgi:AcrR family transcriptional regulator